MFQKITSPSRIQTHDLQICSNVQTHCATPLDNNFKKEKLCKIILDLIVYFDRMYVTIWRRPIPPFKVFLGFFIADKRMLIYHFKFDL